MFELAPEDSLEALFSFYEAKVFQSGYLREELEDTRKEAEREKAKILNNIARTCRTILRKLSITQDTGLRGRIQKLIAAVFPLSHGACTNRAGLFNTNNITTIDEQA